MAEQIVLDHDELVRAGAFCVGCNYWASHAGTAMWSDWQPDVVAADLEQLAGAGLQVLRVFPLWPDFQPLTQLYTGQGGPQELRWGEEPLPDTAAGRAGVSEVAMERFGELADLAGRSGLKLVPGLITGWMSGRWYVPPAFERLNVLADPLALKWQVRFVRYFVRQFRDHPAISAWDLGNECNVLGPVATPDEAWLWTSCIASAIRLEDSTWPVVSGMHSLSPDRRAPWRIQDQAELTDLLTTHPYPIFTPHCDQDPVNTIRPCLHATAESRLYGDIGGRPCIAEELGTLGPMIAGEDVAADYVRTALLSLWAHDCSGLLWWCAYDQSHLAQAPYDWHSHERELGLIRVNRSPKPVLGELGRFADFLKGLSLQALPPRVTEAVCILTGDQDQWGAAYSSFVLAKQAGFDLVFCYADQPLPDAQLYLLPSVSGSRGFTRRMWLELIDHVERGATLYLSHDDCMLSPFNGPFGLDVLTRERRTSPAQVTLELRDGPCALQVPSSIKLTLASHGAEVLGTEGDGNPAMTCHRLGAGAVYLLTVPIERHLAETPGSFHRPEAQPFWRVYQHVAAPFLQDRVVTKNSPWIGATEHPLDDGRRVVILINYSPKPVSAELALRKGWRVTAVWRGEAPGPCGAVFTVTVSANDGLVFTVES